MYRIKVSKNDSISITKEIYAHWVDIAHSAAPEQVPSSMTKKPKLEAIFVRYFDRRIHIEYK